MAKENTSEIKEIENCEMAEENTSEIKVIENWSDTNPQEMMSEEGSVRTRTVKDVGNVEAVISVALKSQEECVLEANEVAKTPSVSLRRHSTGAIGTRGGKLEVQSRYRGNHHVPSTHDLCKHGTRCNRDDAVKPWKVVRRRSVEGSVPVKVETSCLRRRSLGSSAVVKRDALLAVNKKPCASVDGLILRSNDKALKNKGTEGSLSGGSPDLGSEKSSSKVYTPKNLKNKEEEKALKNKGTYSTLSDGSDVVNKVLDLRCEKSSSKVYTPKNKEKAKAQTIRGEDLKEKTVCVVEASVKGVQSEKHASSSEKKTIRSRLRSLATPKQSPGNVSTSKKDEELVANHKPEKKIRAKKTGVKIPIEKQLSFKKGKKTPAPKLDQESTKRVVETQTEGGKKKKNLKGVVESRSDSCEGSKREKVVLRRRNVQGKKKMMTLFNSVIEDTMNKLIKVRKTKVKALIGAFETVISLQDTNETPQSKEATSESKVSSLGGSKH